MQLSDPISPASTEDSIRVYLRENPQFFERHPELLAELYLPSPHGHGTISLAERQQLAQRDKIRVLEAKLSELLHFGEQNDATSDKIHRLCLGLLATPSFDIMMQLLHHSLREDFLIPYFGIHLWATPKNTEDADHVAFQRVEPEYHSWAQNLVTPYCGHKPELEVTEWFGENAAPKSFAVIALKGEKVFGLLALASDDERRFYPEMGTLYLKRIGELISAALLRYTE
ncbi:MAG TPA: DUF484 family protein [Methylophilaceae bacterium]|nr:DUF484 family protein [Methylophilaceae bacterium]